MTSGRNTADEGPIVSTTHGQVRGHLLKGLYDESYYCFDGIPYAAPPIGPLRFKAPQPAAKWTGIRDCTVLPTKCLQVNSLTKLIEGSEDCLYLNIYAKKLTSLAPLPVMVYIHGGIFKQGDPTRRAWAPDYFMHEDVILITMGYRLGVFGFLSFNDPKLEVPGNAGLKDIIESLKWIKANCASFNGDADNITLFGHSSGSWATHLLLLSPQTEGGLFHKAILMSGFTQEIYRTSNLEYRLAKHLGYEGTAEDEFSILEYIKSVNPQRLVDFNFWTQAEIDSSLTMQFAPCIEPYATESAVLLETPMKLQRITWGNSIPIMLGTTSCEGLCDMNTYKNGTELFERFKENPEFWLPTSFLSNCSLDKQREAAKKLVTLHFGERDLSSQNWEQAIELHSYKFYHPQHRLILARLQYAPQVPTYLYRFDFDSPDFNLYRIRHCGKEARGVGHVDDLCYLFVIPATFKLDKSRLEYLNIRRMISIWCEFALRSNPNSSLLKNIKWEPLQSEGPHMCLNISYELRVIEVPENAKCQEIDRIYEEAGLELI